MEKQENIYWLNDILVTIEKGGLPNLTGKTLTPDQAGAIRKTMEIRLESFYRNSVLPHVVPNHMGATNEQIQPEDIILCTNMEWIAQTAYKVSTVNELNVKASIIYPKVEGRSVTIDKSDVRIIVSAAEQIDLDEDRIERRIERAILYEIERRTALATGNKGYAQRPPLGLRPRHIADCERATEILEAMQRFIAEGKPIPYEWIDELRDRVGNHAAIDCRLTNEQIRAIL